MHQTPSAFLHRPLNGQLVPFHSAAACPRRAMRVQDEIRQLLSPKNYPCVAALRSFHRNDFQVGLYGAFGTGAEWRQIRQDLLFFLQEQRRTSSIYLTYWAVFEPREISEAEFEAGLWRELSCLTSVEERVADWRNSATQNPLDPAFRFALQGTDFFVVGLHPQNSRVSRRFFAPALVFNVFEQFQKLQHLGQYESMVATNRKRDELFQGSVNPMVAEHGEVWETIQFSGQKNPASWKCPFQFLTTAEKP